MYGHGFLQVWRDARQTESSFDVYRTNKASKMHFKCHAGDIAQTTPTQSRKIIPKQTNKQTDKQQEQKRENLKPREPMFFF